MSTKNRESQKISFSRMLNKIIAFFKKPMHLYLCGGCLKDYLTREEAMRCSGMHLFRKSHRFLPRPYKEPA